MRQIKFRAKRIDNKEWVYGFLMANYNPKMEENIIDDCYIYLGLRNLSSPIPVIPETVEQFTGLTDKNGKEIYEGDIFKEEMLSPFEEDKILDTEIGIIEWGVWSYMYGYKLGKPIYAFDRIKARKVEIISNIHDNPELLK